MECDDEVASGTRTVIESVGAGSRLMVDCQLRGPHLPPLPASSLPVVRHSSNRRIRRSGSSSTERRTSRTMRTQSRNFSASSRNVPSKAPANQRRNTSSTRAYAAAPMSQ